MAAVLKDTFYPLITLSVISRGIVWLVFTEYIFKIYQRAILYIQQGFLPIHY